jgi:hypothetical protein
MVHQDWAEACIRDLVGAWNRRDWSTLESLYAPDVVYEGPHAAIVGRSAMQRRDEQLVALIPDLHGSDLRISANDTAGHWATFRFLQTGTPISDLPTPQGVRRAGSTFAVHTTMFVRFDEDGRVAGLRTAHA